MLKTGIKRILKSGLVASAITSAVFFAPVENAHAVANINLFSDFLPADPARLAAAPRYMDTAGTWNGATEVTNTTGDTFVLTVQNSGGGVTDAQDISIDVTVPSGFRLPQPFFRLSVSSPTGCNTTTGATRFNNLDATQSGTTVSFNIPANRIIPAGCTYDFAFGLTTNNTVPFATSGPNNLTYDVTYNDGGPTLSVPPFGQAVEVTETTLSVVKTTAATNVIDGTPVSFNVRIRNTGTAGGLFDIDFVDTIGANLIGIQLDVPPPYVDPAFGVSTYTFNGANNNYLAPNEFIDITVDSTVNVVPDDTTCVIQNSASAFDRIGTVNGSGFATTGYDLSNLVTVTHDLTNSYCLLCGQGEVIIDVTNIGGLTLSTVRVTENLNAGAILPSGLTFVPGSVTFNGVGAPDPTFTAGPNPDNTFYWDIGPLDSPQDLTPSNPTSIEIRFLVERDTGAGFTLEGLADPAITDRSISVEATSYSTVCGVSPAPVPAIPVVSTLQLRQPQPTTTKVGWNLDAEQVEGQAGAFVYGHEDDDVIWRVEVNNGSPNADMEDLMVTDTIGGNFTFTAVCANAADAINAAGPINSIGGTCIPWGNPGSNPFVHPPTPGVDAPAGNSGFVYYVGVIQASCSNATNTASIEWGCDADAAPPGSVPGGIDSTNSSILLANTIGTADLNTDVSGPDADPAVSALNELTTVVNITGTNTAQLAGSRGRVSISITNNTGGTVRDLVLTDVFPPLPNVVYVVDPTISTSVDTASADPGITITVNPAYGNTYDGMIDTLTWDNPAAPASPLSNSAPQFSLTSSAPAGAGAFGTNLLRHGDQVIITFDIVLVDDTRYDYEVDMDVREEEQPVSATDPDNILSNISNQLTINYSEACGIGPAPAPLVINTPFDAFPEDLDIDIDDQGSGDISFILNTDANIQLPLRVELTNNGGHDADNFFVVVTFGNAMEVDSFPAGICTDISGSLPTLPRPYWDDPVPIPVNKNPTVIQCDSTLLGAPVVPITLGGATINYDFVVSRNPAAGPLDDDLTFRADVVGEITLSDGSALTFPPVKTTPAVQIDNVANNYSLDGVRGTVIGFGLVKDVTGDCTEQTSYPLRDPDTVFIGEDCEFNITSGGWFGFDTPGFGIIAVHTIEVFDEIPTAASLLPSVQGFISQDDGVNSGAAIQASGITFNPAAPGQLAQGTVSWTFHVPNAVAPDFNKLKIKDEQFIANIKTRILNDPTDTLNPPSALPNRHDVVSRNILNTTFSADFEDSSGNPGVIVFGPGTVGYPTLDLRDYDKVITEPNLVITKEVCNETLAGGTCAPSDFAPAISGGDTEDFYVYRITIENVDDSAGANPSRAPAYNVVAIDTFDGNNPGPLLTDLMQVYPIEPAPVTLDPLKYPFNNDGLDNDGDGATDEGDEAEILTDNIVNEPLNINPAVIKFSYTTTTALEQIDPGEIVRLYYKVDPDDFIAPLQTMANTVDVKYDSLEGLAGSQNATQINTDPDIDLNGSLGSARVYTNEASSFPTQVSTVQMEQLAVDRKIIVQSALTPGPVAQQVPPASTLNVVVGEEVEYRLETLIPVANLREFKVRDELPAGLSCVDVPDVDLSDPLGPYAAAGFSPGGLFTVGNGRITCTDNLVEWDFGDQELTAALGNARFSFVVNFIARVENTPVTNITPFNPGVNNCVLRNGGVGATTAGSPPVPVQACNQDTFVATSYRNDPTQGSVLIEHIFDSIQVQVNEPQIQVTKTFYEVLSVATEETAGDAQDIFEVRVVVENVGDADAYNVQVLDNLVNTKYTYRGGVSGIGVDPPPTSDGGITLPAPGTGAPGTNQPVFRWGPGFTIAPGPGNAISFSYRVQSNDDVEPLESVANTIEAKWTSLEDNTVSLNSGGAIAADGDVLGMRNGYFPSTEPVPANVENDYIFNSTDTIDVPGLLVTKTDLDLAVPPTIGAHKRFQIDIDLPEGITTNVSISDNLNFGDQSYVLENEPGLEVQYEFFGIRTINGVAPVDGTTTNFLAEAADEDINTAAWNIGLVTTETEDDSPLNATPSINPRIRITYISRVNNDLVTNAGINLRNEATLQYTSGLVPPTVETVTSATNNVTVIEPVLTVTKVADVATADAGDVIQYTVTISHDAASTADAFDINIVDTLPTNVLFTSAISLQVNGVDTGIAAPSVAGQTLTWGRTNAADDTLDIPLGESLVLIYTVTVQNSVQPLEIIENGVVVDWTSLDGDITGLERIGIGGATCTFNAASPDDYCVGPTIARVDVVDNNLIVKTKTNDSFNLGPAGTDLRIGDIVEYTLTLTLQEGTTRDLSLVDTLPNGLEFVDVVSVNGDVTAPYTSANGFIHNPINVPVPTPAGAGNNVLTWDIGDAIAGIINSANDGNNDFVIVYRAVVTKDEFVLPQVAPGTTPVNNTVVMDYIDVNGIVSTTAPLARLTSTVNLNVQEPIIFTANIVKDRYPSGIPSGSTVSSGELIDFRLLACNVGTGPAYDLNLVDNLPVELRHDLIAGLDVDFTDPTGVTQLTQLTAGVEYVYTPPAAAGGNMVFDFNDVNAPLPANQCIRILFTIPVDVIGVNFSWTNQFDVTIYHSLDADDANADVPERQIYAPAGPVFYNMNTVSPNNPPEKVLWSPINGVDPNHDEATIGQEVIYQITVPSDDDDIVALPNPNPMGAALFRVRLEDNIPADLVFVSAALDPASPYTQVAPLSVTLVAGNLYEIALDPAGFLDVVAGETQPAIINLTTRVRNDPATTSAVPPFGNTASYWFTRSLTDLTEIPGGSDTTDPANEIYIVEPELTLMAKTVTNLTQAIGDTNAGDVLQYTLTFNTSGGAANDIYSDAFDVSIIDTLDPGMDYCSPVEDVNCINPTSSIGTMEASRAAIISGTGTVADPHIISWNSVNGTNTDIDVPEGTALVTITYTVKVMDSVLANNTVDSSTQVTYTSLDGDFAPDERLYSAVIASAPSITVPVLNDLAKTLNANTSTLAGPNDVRIGDVVDYQFVISMQEATSSNFVLTDTLPQGLKYEGIVSINGDSDGSFEPVAPFVHPVYTQADVVSAGDPVTGSTTVTWNLGNLVNTGNNVTTDDDFTIIYRARVLDLSQPLVAPPFSPLTDPQSDIDLVNTVVMNYDAALVDINNLNNTYTITIDQPNLSLTKVLDPVVPDTVIESDEIITYRIDVTNNGQSPAYDIVIEDILPFGLRNGITPVTITQIEMPIGNVLPFTALQLSAMQTYVAATGQILWDLDTGIANELTLAPTQTMRVTYQVQADTALGAGLNNITNDAKVLRYHSFDDEELPTPVNVATGIVPAVVPVREIYGPGVADSVTLTTVGPGALSKLNQADTLISIGETFVYTIKVPDVPITTALHDVRILDDLSAIPGVDLIYVSVAAVDDDGQPADEDDNYTPINTSGDLFNLEIEDIVDGIEIPAGETITVEVTVQLVNSPNNVGVTVINAVGDLFANTADYTFNGIDNDDASVANGAPNSTGDLTVVEPFLSITKAGPAAPNTVIFNTPIPYRLVVENMGSGPAYDVTITDDLPDVPDNAPLTGGTCNTLPNNIHVQVFDNAEVAIVGRPELTQGVDYTVTHLPAPVCDFVITTLTPAAVVESTEKLIITYDTYLDVDSQNGALLTNTASVTRYFSLDTPAGVVFGQIREYQNNVVSILDEASYTVQVEAPELVITKVPDNLTTGGSGAFADPGDKLHYTINIQNNGPVPTGIFRFLDEPDRLNLAPGYYDFSTLTNVLINGAAPVPPVTVSMVAGVLEIQNLNVGELGSPTISDNLTIEFDIDLIPVIDSGIVVVNQGELDVVGFSLLPTDDPAIGGLADPTETLIDAAPTFLVEKRSADVTGDPNILVQGDTLRYTLEVKNIGLENVNGAFLRDLVPANTSYVAGSTTLNGNSVPDIVVGESPLESEMLINAPENLTPGFMRADANLAVLTNVATVTFDVIVDLDVVDGTVISNQGFVGGLGSGSGPFAEQASNDPDTTITNDPTVDVVGNLPALNAQKTVALFDDVDGDGIVDVGDTLEYTIIVSNGGAIAATQVSLVDAIDADSTYVPNSVFLNDSVTPVPDGTLVSLSPLTVRFNSTDLGVHNQAANDGQVSAGNEAKITFRVIASGAPGSLISNQGEIISNELPIQLTDSDGNSTNGSQTTDIYIGVGSELQLTKEVFVVGGGVALAGGTLEYVLTVENTGVVDATNVLLTDVIPANVTYTIGSTKLDGSTTFIGSGVTEPGANLLVDYQLAKGALEAGEKFTVTYRVVSDAGLVEGTQILNTATVTWTQMTAAITDTASIEIGGAPGVGVIGGNVWHDIIRTPAGVFDSGTDLNLEFWTVQLYLNNPARNLYATTVTDVNGDYQFKGIPPISIAGGEYELRFIPPGGSDTSASMGRTVVDVLHGADSGTIGEMAITGITVNAGVNIAEENLPAIPHGVLYDSVLRTTVAGATISLVQTNGAPVPANCLPANSNQATQTTLASGFYRFDIQAGTCGITDFVIQIDTLPTNYLAGTSVIIPPGKAGNTQIDVPVCSDSAEDMITGNGDCDIQFSEQQPDISVPVRTDSTRTGSQGTTYYLEMRANTDGEVAFNNHIPLDPELSSAVAVSKVSAMVNVTRGQLVPYTITLTNTLPAPIFDLDVEDLYPAGFKYIAGSGRIQRGNAAAVKTEPVLDTLNKRLVWQNLAVINGSETVTLKLLLVVGSGVGEGEYVNRAQVRNNLTNTLASGQASATVRVVPDPTFDCSDVIGKAFDDKNLNAYQDEGEPGLPGVRVVTARGLEITADEHGRFHITCAVVPNADRGSNFILKLDERSLPTGYRLTTENPRVVRATRGKMLKFNFGAAIHRVIRLDMADAVFEPGTTEMRPQWLPRLDLLMTELAKDPSLLRLSYLADNETESEVNERLDAVKEEIENRWKELNCCYQLMIETEVFWRKGGPVDRGALDD